MMTDLQKERQTELTSAKQSLEAKIASLKTKEGSEQFNKNLKAVCDAVLNKKPRMTPTVEGRITMAQLLSVKRSMLEKFPEKVVAEEIQAAEKRLAEVKKEIEVIDVAS